MARIEIPDPDMAPLGEAAFIGDTLFDLGMRYSVGDSVPVSAGGGFAPRWRGDGKELFYLKIDGSVMAIEANTARDGQGQTPTTLKLTSWHIRASVVRKLNRAAKQPEAFADQPL